MKQARNLSLLAAFVLSFIWACADKGSQAGGTSVETTNGFAVQVELPSAVRPDSLGEHFALRLSDLRRQGERWCVLSSGDTLPYAFRGKDLWVKTPGHASALDLWPDTLDACPLSDSASVFSADNGYIAMRDFGGAFVDGETEALSWGLLQGEPQAYTFSAEVLLDSGLVGGEVWSVGDVAGFRMDNLDSMAALYGYASYAGVSNWNVISGHTPIGDSTWIRVDLVVDAVSSRYELYFDGILHFAYSDSLPPLSYDKQGAELTLGRNAAGTGGYFRGRLGSVSVSTVARSPDWIRLSAFQGRTGPGFRLEPRP